MNPVVLSTLGVILALIALSLLCFKGFHPVVVGLLASAIVALTGGLNLLDSILKSYVPGVAAFFTSYFIIFFFSALLGKIYEETGAAKTVAEKLSNLFGPKLAMLAVCLSTAALIYGGITSFVVIFAIYPIALVLFEKADIPDRLIPGIVCLGLWSFAMTGPASTQIQNIMPMQALGTSSVAGGFPGVIGAVCMFAFGIVYMMWMEKRARVADEHFEFPTHVERFSDDRERPGIIPALIPLIFVIIVFNVFKWNINIALFISVILSVALFFRYFPEGQLVKTLNEGAAASVTVIINTAAIVGFGSVVKSVPFFEKAVEFLSSSNLHPYVVSLTTANGLAGIMGSSSGSIALTLTTLDATIKQWGAMGYNLGYIHRLISVGGGGLDSLPHCGAIISVLAVCGLTHKKAYFPIFVNCTVIPMLVSYGIMLPLMMLMG